MGSCWRRLQCGTGRQVGTWTSRKVLEQAPAHSQERDRPAACSAVPAHQPWEEPARQPWEEARPDLEQRRPAAPRRLLPEFETVSSAAVESADTIELTRRKLPARRQERKCLWQIR